MSAPMIHLESDRHTPDVHSINALLDLLVDTERRLASGPWDEWDAVALEQCRTVLRRRMSQAIAALVNAAQKNQGGAA